MDETYTLFLTEEYSDGDHGSYEWKTYRGSNYAQALDDARGALGRFAYDVVGQDPIEGSHGRIVAATVESRTSRAHFQWNDGVPSLETDPPDPVTPSNDATPVTFTPEGREALDKLMEHAGPQTRDDVINRALRTAAALAEAIGYPTPPPTR